jgi:1,4-dihydroxy-2-naphthoate octaprenyltransferase
MEQSMTRKALVLQTFRIPFLLLTPICILLGIASASAGDTVVSGVDIALVLLGALAAHVSVNTLNEYQDFHSGLDLTTKRTPFSGGSGALPAAPGLAGAVLGVALTALATTIAVGIYFAYLRGPLILPIGLAGIAIIVSYTRWINRHPLLCLVAPGIAFGPLMVIGTDVALTGHYATLPLVAALVPFFLVNNLLLFNQYPDLEADRRAGRRHFPIAFGLKASNRVYAAFAAGAYLSIVAGVCTGLFPIASLLALLPAGFNISALIGVRACPVTQHGLIPSLGRNVIATLSAPLLLAVTLLLR